MTTIDMEQPPIRVLECKAHQVEAYWFAFDKPATMLSMDMGTMKSKVGIDLMVNWECETAMVICPKNVMGVWRREFAKHGGGYFDVLVLDKGTVKAKTRLAANHINNRRGPCAIVVNYESARVKEFAERALRPQWGCVLLDESHHVKSHKSKQSKFVAKLGLHATRRLCLTGTPMGNSPLDLFGQFRFLDPTIFGTLWTPFRARYAITGCAAIPQMITGFQNQDELKELMASISFRVGAEVLDLPPEQHHVRTFSLCPTAMRHYRELEKEMITEIASGVCTAANCLVRSTRLRQAASGYIVEDDTKAVHRIDDGRQNLLADLLEDMGPREPVVVFTFFTHELDRVREVAEKLGRRYGEVSGRRRDLTSHALMPDDIDILGVNMSAGGEGVDLTRARYGVFYSQPWTPGLRDQTIRRINRPGQTRPVSYYHLEAENTIDVKVREALEKKQKVVDVVLDVFRKGGS